MVRSGQRQLQTSCSLRRRDPRNEKQTRLTDEEKVADIMERLLGIKWCVKRGKGPPEITDIHQDLIPDIPLTFDDIACFWTTVAYAIYHKNLVWQWFQSTHAKSRIAACSRHALVLDEAASARYGHGCDEASYSLRQISA